MRERARFDREVGDPRVRTEAVAKASCARPAGARTGGWASLGDRARDSGDPSRPGPSGCEATRGRAGGAGCTRDRDGGSCGQVFDDPAGMGRPLRAPAGGTVDPGRVDGRRGAAESAAGIGAPIGALRLAGSSRQVRKRIESPCASRPAATAAVRRRDSPRERLPSVRRPLAACAPIRCTPPSLAPGVRMQRRAVRCRLRPRAQPGPARQRRSSLR